LTGPIISVGKNIARSVIKEINSTPLSGSSFLSVSPEVGDTSSVIITDNIFDNANGGDFFDPGLQGDISSVADNSSTGSITAFADNGSGGTTVTSSSAHGLSDGRTVTLSGTTNYNGTFVISAASGSVYDIATAFVADDATGTWNFNSITVTTSAPHTLSDGSAVQIAKSYEEYNKGRAIFNASGSVFDVDNVVFVATGTGKYDSGSLKENEPRMIVRSNTNQSDTAQILVCEITVTEPIVLTLNTPTPVTSWVTTSDDQFTFDPPGQPAGTFRYDGLDVRANIDSNFVFVATSGNPGDDIEFTVYKSTPPAAFSQIGVAALSTLTNKQNSAIVSIVDSITKGDLLQIRVENLSGSASIDIDNASLTVFTVAQGA